MTTYLKGLRAYNDAFKHSASQEKLVNRSFAEAAARELRHYQN